MTEIRIDHLHKRFADFVAVKDSSRARAVSSETAPRAGAVSRMPVPSTAIAPCALSTPTLTHPATSATTTR